MNQISKIWLILTLLIINACSMFSDKKQAETKQNNLVSQDALTSYKQQEHRLAFNGCELTYNEKPFYLGQQIEDVIKILGPYNQEVHKYGGVAFVWDELGIYLVIREINSKGKQIPKEKQSINILKIIFKYREINPLDSESIKNRMEKRRKDFPAKKDYILVNEVPLKRETIMKDYMKQTGKDFGFFTSRSRSGYSKIYKDCQEYPTKQLDYYFTTDVDFESTDYGKVAITGDPIHGTHEVTAFSVSLDEKE